MKEKARLVTDLFNKIEGVKCNPVQGAMYAFPQIRIPEKAIKHAKVKIFWYLDILKYILIYIIILES